MILISPPPQGDGNRASDKGFSMINEDTFDPIRLSQLAKIDLEVDKNQIFKGTLSPYEAMVISNLQRIANSLEVIERHLSFRNGTLEGMTKNY